MLVMADELNPIALLMLSSVNDSFVQHLVLVVLLMLLGGKGGWVVHFSD